MLKKLFHQLFLKLEQEKSLQNLSKNGKAVFFVEEVLDKRFNNFGLISSRSLKEYFDKYVEGKENKSGEPKNELKDCIAEYLDYIDYEEFVLKNKNSGIKKNYILFYSGIVIVFLIVGSYFFQSSSSNIEENLCPVWVQDHFEMMDCKGENPNELLKKVDVEYFRKVSLNKESVIFKNGHPLYWYGKSIDGEFEFFNSRGVHPITLKELRPITQYIFEKYVIE